MKFVVFHCNSCSGLRHFPLVCRNMLAMEKYVVLEGSDFFSNFFIINTYYLLLLLNENK